MATDLRILKATKSDAIHVGQNLRQADLEEVYRASGHGPVEGILEVWRMSEDCKVVIDTNGLPIVVYGVIPTTSGAAAPWALGTSAIDDHRIELMKLARRELTKWRHRYGHLCNYVDAKQEGSIDFLRVVGFTFSEETMPMGPKGDAFYQFEMGG